jgi:Domain of unknown function (DUF5594)
MTQEIAQRFEAQFAPRIAESISGVFGQRIKVEVIPNQGSGHPTRIHLHGEPTEPSGRFAHPLNAYLTWDGGEIEALFGADGEAKFARYLAALPNKIFAWQVPRLIDFRSRTQAEVSVLLGGLDFES